jgi:hypothetical protein
MSCHVANFDSVLRYDPYNLLPWSLAEGTPVFSISNHISVVLISPDTFIDHPNQALSRLWPWMLVEDKVALSFPFPPLSL